MPFFQDASLVCDACHQKIVPNSRVEVVAKLTFTGAIPKLVSLNETIREPVFNEIELGKIPETTYYHLGCYGC